MNDIITNPDKFQAMIKSCDKKKKKTNMIYKLNFEKACFHYYFILYILIKAMQSIVYIFVYYECFKYLFL